MFLRILLQSLSNCCGVKTYLIYYCLHINFFAHNYFQQIDKENRYHTDQNETNYYSNLIKSAMNHRLIFPLDPHSIHKHGKVSYDYKKIVLFQRYCDKSIKETLYSNGPDFQS